MKKSIFQVSALLLLLAASLATMVAQTAAVPPASTKQLGSIRKISGTDMTLATDQGVNVAVRIASNTRLLRLAPGQTDLKSAAQIQLSDLQAGDRVLVRGKIAPDGTLDAAAVVVMKQQDIAQQREQEILDWQKRSVGGVVKQADAAGQTITISIPNGGEAKTLTLATTAKTSVRRYSPTSVKWEDATTATLNDIHPGDQLRAKGNKNEDGTQMIAEEIVAGTFRNLSGLITAIDPTQNTLTVQDLATKKAVTVKVTPDSQMKKLPAQVAAGLATRIKGGAVPKPVSQTTAPAAAPGAPGNGEHQRSGDLNQILGHLPAASLADLQKGEAVMIVSTQGSASEPPMAVTLLGGVEPLLTAAGSGAQSFLTPWSLAGAPGGDQ